jgi:hypothetical protein
VVVLHDADWPGCKLAAEIADDPRWFAGVELPRVVDAGLRPADTKRFRGLFQRATSRYDDPAPGVTPEEAKWLGKYRLELAAARPRVLMGALGNVLRGESEPGGAGAPWLVGDAWGDGDDEVG